MPNNLFINYNFLLFPNSKSKLSVFRKKLFRQNGAKLHYSLNSLNSLDDKSIVIIFDYDGEFNKNSEIFKELNKFYNENYDKFKDYPIVKIDWVINSIDKQKIQNFKNYEIKFANEYKRRKIDKTVENEEIKEIKEEKEEISDTDLESDITTTDIESEDETINSIINKDVKIDTDNQSDNESEELIKYLKTTTNTKSKDNSSNPNAKIIEILQEMSKELSSESKIGINSFKSISYRNAINSINNYNKPIKSYDEAINIPGIGKKIALKIEEILKTGELHQLLIIKNDENHQKIKNFNKIFGIGNKLSNKLLFKYNINSIDDLKNNKKILNKLTKFQKIGLNYYNDWNIKIPRNEIKNHLNFIKDSINKNIKLNKLNLNIEIWGSYLRGVNESGDIDIIFYIKNENNKKKLSNCFLQILNYLKNDLNYLIVDLVSIDYSDIDSNYNNNSNNNLLMKYMGGCKLNKDSICRRIDFLIFPYNEYGSTKLYFVGNDLFNRKLRFIAKKKNLNLNQHGLFKRVDDKNNKSEELIESFSELKILNYLGIKKFIPYNERNL
ncbi:hypothetical protein B5S29_g5379 [[Candida] boidinii]|nr:hypothetical protein B5S29_g5379 [[Candida] boidinii]GME86691.1 unnamed protein product [[Candida] boidinii]